MSYMDPMLDDMERLEEEKKPWNIHTNNLNHWRYVEDINGNIFYDSVVVRYNPEDILDHFTIDFNDWMLFYKYKWIKCPYTKHIICDITNKKLVDFLLPHSEETHQVQFLDKYIYDLRKKNLILKELNVKGKKNNNENKLLPPGSFDKKGKLINKNNDKKQLINKNINCFFKPIIKKSKQQQQLQIQQSTNSFNANQFLDQLSKPNIKI